MLGKIIQSRDQCNGFITYSAEQGKTIEYATSKMNAKCGKVFTVSYGRKTRKL